MVQITTTTQDTDWSAHRAGQAFSADTINMMVDRDPYVHLLCGLLPIRALGNGFDLVGTDDKEEVLTNNDDIWKILKKPWAEVVRGALFERAYGLCDYVLYKNDNSDAPEEEKVFLKMFQEKQIESTKLTYNKDMSIKEIAWNENDPSSGEATLWEVKDLKDLYHNVQRRREKWWEGRSYIEPIWDEIIGLRLIRSGAVLYAVRVGAGLKIVKIPPNTDPDVVAQMKTAAKTLDSLNGFFLMPVDEAEITIDSGSGMVDYAALKRVCLEAITGYTGLPMAAFVGIEMERQGAEYNQESEFDFLREIQRLYKPIAKWLCLRLSEVHNWGLTEDSFNIQWRIREELSDKAQAETDAVRAQADATDINAGILSAEEVRASRGLKGKAPERPDMFNMNVKGLQQEEEPDEEEEE